MDAKCKTCWKEKDEKKMLRCKYASEDTSGVIIYGCFYYWYFCGDDCLSQYHKEQQEQPVEVIKPEEPKNKKTKETEE